MKNMFNEFKAFISKGNVIDMAVGVIIGGAFNTIVLTLNKQILMPIVNWALSFIPGMQSGLYTILPNSVLATSSAASDAVTLGPDGLSYTVLNYIDWSAFIESILNFFFIALTLFVILKVVTTLAHKRKELEDSLREKLAEAEAKKASETDELKAEEVVAPEPVKDPVVVLLEEIRDNLKKEQE